MSGTGSATCARNKGAPRTIGNCHLCAPVVTLQRGAGDGEAPTRGKQWRAKINTDRPNVLPVSGRRRAVERDTTPIIHSGHVEEQPQPISLP